MLDRLLILTARYARWVPETLLRGFFLLAADVSWLLRVGGVRQLEANLTHVVGPVGRKRLRHISRRGMRSYFTYFSETLTVGARTTEQLKARIRPAGTGYPEPAKTMIESRSVPIGMGHQGNWDYAGFWAGRAVGPVTTVAERLSNEELLETFVQIRRELGINIILTGEHGITERLADTLANPEQVVPLLADRDLSRNGVFVRAFDSWIRVAAGPAVIALDSHLPLYTVNMYRERLTGDRRHQAGTPLGYICSIDGPIDTDAFQGLPRDQAVQELSQAWVDQWSRGIREHPEDWHMLQPIFIEDLDLSRMHAVPEHISAEVELRRGKARGNRS